MKAVAGSVCEVECFVERGIGLENKDGCEGFFCPEREMVRNGFEDGGKDGRSMSGASTEEAGAVLKGFSDRLEGSGSGGLIDHRAYEDLWVSGITDADLGLGVGEKAFCEGGVYGCVDEDALDADAGLACESKGRLSNEGDGGVQIGIGVHEDRGVASQLEGAAFAGSLALQCPAYLGAPGEREHADSRIRDPGADEFVGASEDIELAWGRACSLHDGGKEQGA